MEWVSDELGLLTTFPDLDHLESDERLNDPAWMPVGTRLRPWSEIEQGWEAHVWEDNDFVYVQQGGGWSRLSTWYRVPAKQFRHAWREGTTRIRGTVPPPPRLTRHERAKLFRGRPSPKSPGG